MSRFLIVSLLTLTFLISGAGVAPAAHAQTTQIFDAGSTLTTGSTGETSATPSTAAAPVDAKAAAIPSPYKGDITGYSFNGIMAYIVQLFAWLLGVGAVTLDNAVFYTVVTMGNYVNHLSAIGVTWRILRDIANIMLIFGFLGAGIATILNVDQYGWKTKMLPMLFVGAIFLNFSLFITEAMIDGTNLFATQFYQQINGGQAAGAKTFSLSSINNEGISNKIMSNLGLQTIYGEAQNPAKAKALFENYWTIGFMSIILFIVAAFVFFALAFILIARFVALVFFIILSPVGFMGLAIPQMQYRAKQWWTNFLEQIITAPILMLLLYVALAVITDVQFLTGFSDCIAGVPSTVANSCSNPSYIGYADGNFNGFASVILSFLVAMGLLLVVVIKAKSMSAFGAGWASQAAGKLTYGATAFAGRRTVGRLSNYTARKIRSSGFGRSDMGKLFAGVADKGAKASFDIRGTGVFKKIPHVDVGEAQKGGYHGREEELIKSRIDYSKTLRQTDKERIESEKAENVKKILVDDHDTAMKPLERREREQLVAVRDASTKELKDQARDALEVTRNEIALKKSEHQAKMNEQDVIIKGNSTAAAQKQYGKALEKHTVFGVIPRQPYDWPTAVGSARAEASHRIIGEANKDASLKKLDEIANALGKSAPAPSTPPPAAGH